MKMRFKIKGNDSQKEVVVTVSVRTNQPRQWSLTHGESQTKLNAVCDSIQDAMRKHFHAREIQFVK